ncbi:MAG: nucleotidyltransferase domain-containing protein [Corynebacterium sp.]|uniref:nucleotidyltransferase family protein n=1 Tax=Corynebacterium sp. TaxID=1720 RepID=UPI0026DB8193|nr:nucleotidyltransferase domain-containing protein [Corynebacterium sp.]MDO5099005.1 nucleotidyltransferase domain-containing protein [Corynebacterium sp.]
MITPSTSTQNYDLPKEQIVLAILRRFGVVRAQLFGSAARGELGPNSDIDLLVELDGKVDYGKLLLLSEELEVATGRRFDVLTSIKEVFRPYIEPELVELPL